MTEACFTLAGVLLGAWITHRSRVGLSPLPKLELPHKPKKDKEDAGKDPDELCGAPKPDSKRWKL